MAADRIAVVEPQSRGMVHSPFNAALLHTVALAYPAATLCFYASASHRDEVKAILREVAPEVASRLEWQTLAEPPIEQSTVARWLAHRQLLRQVLAPGQRTLLCSINRLLLMQLLQNLKRRRRADPVRVVLHGELELLEQERNGWRHPLSLGRLLARSKPAALRYILLGRSIRDNLPPGYGAALADAGLLDHPYHFTSSTAGLPPRFIVGVFGNAGEAHEIEAIATRVKRVQPDVDFRLIGFVSSPSVVDRLSPLVENVGTVPLTRRAFTESARDITYALWLAPPSGFRLRASGTFFDALSFLKPLIYTANPFVDSYVAGEPRSAVRCATLEDVPAAILDRASLTGAEEYEEAQAAMLRLRQRFTPAALAMPLRRALDWD